MSRAKRSSDDQPAKRRKPRASAASPTTTPADTTQPVSTHSAVLLRVDLPVRWRDLDAFSHVNNSVFLTYVEEARLQWFQSLPGPWLSDHIAPVLAATHVNYRRPIEWPARLAVELRAERVGNTSLTLAHRIVGVDNADALYSDGYSVLVWIDRHDGKPAPLPEAVRTACMASD